MGLGGDLSAGLNSGACLSRGCDQRQQSSIVRMMHVCSHFRLRAYIYKYMEHACDAHKNASMHTHTHTQPPRERGGKKKRQKKEAGNPRRSCVWSVAATIALEIRGLHIEARASPPVEKHACNQTSGRHIISDAGGSVSTMRSPHGLTNGSQGTYRRANPRVEQGKAD